MVSGVSKKVNFLVSSASGDRCMRLVGVSVSVRLDFFEKTVGCYL